MNQRYVRTMAEAFEIEQDKDETNPTVFADEMLAAIVKVLREDEGAVEALSVALHAEFGGSPGWPPIQATPESYRKPAQRVRDALADYLAGDG